MAKQDGKIVIKNDSVYWQWPDGRLQDIDDYLLKERNFDVNDPDYIEYCRRSTKTAVDADGNVTYSTEFGITPDGRFIYED